jgi:restriction endonuclease Mrr
VGEINMNSGYSFEMYVAKLFREKGFQVKTTSQSRDHGIDIIMHKDGKTIGVECKHYGRSHKVGREIIQKFDSALNHNPYSDKPMDYGYVVTTSTFTPDACEAVELMNSHYKCNRIMLIDGIALRKMSRNKSHGIWAFLSKMPLKSKILLILGAAFVLIYVTVGVSEAIKYIIDYINYKLI